MRGPLTLILPALVFAFAAMPARAEGPPASGQSPAPYAEDEDEFEAKFPERERDFIQIVRDARTEATATHDYKDARMGLQIRVMRFYEQGHDLEGWQGTVQAIHVTEDHDVWVSIKIADGITLSTSPTRRDDPHYGSLIRSGSTLSAAAAGLKTGQPIIFTATLLRYVNDSDEDMIKTPRLLGHFTALKPLD